MWSFIPVLLMSVHLTFVTVRAKTSLVHTSIFATLVVHIFPYERHIELTFAGFVEQTSLDHC